MHRTADVAIEVEQGRYLAEHIPGAKLVELAGEDHAWWVGDTEAISNEIEEFLTGERPATEPNRVLATVLFTDMVDSTRRAAELGDRRWRDLLESHHAMLSKEISHFRGRYVESTGDGCVGPEFRLKVRQKRGQRPGVVQIQTQAPRLPGYGPI